LIAFGVWGLTWAIALATQRRLQQAWQLELGLLGATVIFGMVLEAIQGAWMPGRIFDLADVIADLAGAACSLGLFSSIFGRRPGRIASD
jgi:VanZ family protein